MPFSAHSHNLERTVSNDGPYVHVGPMVFKESPNIVWPIRYSASAFVAVSGLGFCIVLTATQCLLVEDLVPIWR